METLHIRITFGSASTSFDGVSMSVSLALVVKKAISTGTTSGRSTDSGVLEELGVSSVICSAPIETGFLKRPCRVGLLSSSPVMG